MTDVLVYATASRVDTARSLLAAACQATGLSAALDVYESGSLYQRLGPRHAPPLPDLVLWSGPYAAHAAALDGLLQAYQPAQLADGAAHDPDWRWVALDYSVFTVTGPGPISAFDDLATVPRIALPDPERSEVGMLLLLATLDRARQAGGDPEPGWSWWKERARNGLKLAEDGAGALALVDSGEATHALGLGTDPPGLAGLAPVPHAVSLAASSRRPDAARRLLDWMTSQAAARVLRLSAWQAPPSTLDVAWGTQAYNAARLRWAQSGFGPTP